MNRLMLCVSTLLVPTILLSQPSRQSPSFRTAARAIEVDVTVLKGGDPVRDLTREDFEILEDGVAQPITNLSFIELAGATGASGASVRSRSVGTEPEGRTIVMLLGVRNERLWEVARTFVEKGLGPGDLVAVASAYESADQQLAFTTSREDIMAAVGRSTRAAGSDHNPDSLLVEGINGRDAVTAAFAATRKVATLLGGISGRRKIIVWFWPPSVFSPNSAQRNALRAAARQNVAIYAVDPRGLTTRVDTGALLRQADYRAITDDTGGDSIVGSNDFGPAFERFLRESSSYYLLAYEPAVEHTDGKFHEIDVKVKRKGLSVRARRGYFAPQVGK